MTDTSSPQTTPPTGKQILAWQLSIVCRQQGAEAWRRGLGRMDNPYAQDQEVEHFAWADGWSREAGCQNMRPASAASEDAGNG